MTENLRFIITGGPGTGKSSLVSSLKDQGFCVFPEAARQMIQDGHNAPIRDPKAKKNKLFFNEILKRRIGQHQSAPLEDISFFDRGIPDSLAFFEYMDIRKPKELISSVKKYKYNSLVFLLPPWKEIFHKDEVRRESFDELVRIHHYLKKVYSELAYDFLELPRVSLEERMQIVIEKAESIKAH